MIALWSVKEQQAKYPHVESELIALLSCRSAFRGLLARCLFAATDTVDTTLRCASVAALVVFHVCVVDIECFIDLVAKSSFVINPGIVSQVNQR